MNPQLALVTLVPVPVLAFVSHRYADRIRDKYNEVRERVGVLNASIDNSVSGIAVVKSDTNEDRESERVREDPDEGRVRHAAVDGDTVRTARLRRVPSTPPAA